MGIYPRAHTCAHTHKIHAHTNAEKMVRPMGGWVNVRIYRYIIYTNSLMKSIWAYIQDGLFRVCMIWQEYKYYQADFGSVLYFLQNNYAGAVKICVRT